MFISKKAKEVSPSSTLAIDAKYKAMQAEGLDVVGFGTGEPDFDTPEHIKEAAKAALDKGITKYTPASGMPALKKAICDKLKKENGLDYNVNQIVVSNGAKHSLMNIFSAICDPGDEIIIPAPYWVSYPEMVKMADGVPVFIPSSEEQGFKVGAKDIEKYVTDKTRGVIICSPSNPTGMLYTKEELLEIGKLALKHNMYIISDEVYEHLVYDENKFVSIASLGEEYKNITIVVNAVSKTYAMTGWRIGYTASSKELAAVMGNIQSHATSNPNSIAQMASIAALEGSLESVLKMKEAFNERRLYMVDRINKIDGVSCLTPGGAFYIMMNISRLKGKSVDGKIIKTSDDFADIFLEKCLVAVVAGSGFGADDYLRWSYAASMDTIRKGLDRLEEFIKMLK